MKKILAIALALVMVLAMVACGEKPAPPILIPPPIPPLLSSPTPMRSPMR